MYSVREIMAKLTAAILCITGFASSAHADDQRINAALAAREHGDNAHAITLLRAVAADHPADADTLRQLGTTLAFAHRYREAIAVLDHALALSPRDGDIILVLARARLWSGDVHGAQRVAAKIAAFDPSNSELREVSKSIANAEHDGPKTMLDLAETVSHVAIGGSNAHWFETVGTLSVPTGPRTLAVAGVDVENRTTSADARLSLRGDQRFDWGTAYVAVTATPSATFRERWSIAGGAVIRFTPMLLGSIEIRRAHYDLVDVTVVDASATIHSPTSERWSVAAHSISLWGEDGRHHLGWSLRGDVSPSSALRLFGGGATYSDTEAGITRRVDSAFLGASMPVSRRLSAQLVVDHEVRYASYRRDGVTLGLHWRFDR